MSLDPILPTPEDDIARILANFEKRISHLERLENFESGLGARVFNSVAVPIANGVTTVLTFDSERFDTDNIHSTVFNTGRLTANTAGLYSIYGNVEWAANPVNARLQIELNAAATGIGLTQLVADYRAMNVSTAYQLAINDFVQLSVFQLSGVPINITANAQISPEFMMVKVG